MPFQLGRDQAADETMHGKGSERREFANTVLRTAGLTGGDSGEMGSLERSGATG